MKPRWMRPAGLAVLLGALLGAVLLTGCGGGGGSKNAGAEAAASAATPVQAGSSLAVTVLAIEGLSFDGAQTQLTLSLADRQGNPVPDGVTVTFAAESGLLSPPSCVVQGGASRCSTTLRSQGVRPVDGRVSVLAYVAGEEDFTDLNGNGRWDTGEPFVDTGNAYRDDNENGVWDAAEFYVPRAGAAACSASAPLSRPGTCDSAWSRIDVRQQAVVVFAGSDAVFGSAIVPGTGSFSVTISDINGNSMPNASLISAVVRGAEGSACQAELSDTAVPNQLGALTLTVRTSQCVVGDVIVLRVTAPSGRVSSRSYAVAGI